MQSHSALELTAIPQSSVKNQIKYYENWLYGNAPVDMILRRFLRKLRKLRKCSKSLVERYENIQRAPQQSALKIPRTALPNTVGAVRWTLMPVKWFDSSHRLTTRRARVVWQVMDETSVKCAHTTCTLNNNSRRSFVMWSTGLWWPFIEVSAVK